MNLSNLKNDLEKTISFLIDELSSLHTGRASGALIDGVEVESYGSKMPIKQVANISVTSPKTIQIQPWDKSNLQAIEKAVRESDLNVSPINNGENIIINLPELTQDRRQEFIRIAREKAEVARVGVRNHRRDALEALKKEKNEGSASEDEAFNREKEVQKIIDGYNKKIDEILQKKEKELLEV